MVKSPITPTQHAANKAGLERMMTARRERLQKQQNNPNFPAPGTIMVSYTDAAGFPHVVKGSVDIESDSQTVRLAAATLTMKLASVLTERGILAPEQYEMEEEASGHLVCA